ncbi:hypothetical protein TURU_115280 [Turdus rufiventris]|nr:hypothetical protein TURU_115280 [Turdus rufiventris]
MSFPQLGYQYIRPLYPAERPGSGGSRGGAELAPSGTLSNVLSSMYGAPYAAAAAAQGYGAFLPYAAELPIFPQLSGIVSIILELITLLGSSILAKLDPLFKSPPGALGCLIHCDVHLDVVLNFVIKRGGFVGYKPRFRTGKKTKICHPVKLVGRAGDFLTVSVVSKRNGFVCSELVQSWREKAKLQKDEKKADDGVTEAGPLQDNDRTVIIDNDDM